MSPLQSVLIALVVALWTPTSTADDFPPIRDWNEVTVPPKSQMGDYMVWYYAGNYSPHEWRVFLKDDQVHAKLRKKSDQPSEKLSFIPKTKEFSYIADTLRVEDGWLVGFNEGEWGGALYWFSPDGKKNYKISNHLVVDLFLHRNVIHAIEGLSHLGSSNGSLIFISRSKNRSRWEAKSVLKLPQAPNAVSTLRDGRLLLTLSDSIVSISPDYSLTTLLPDIDFDGLYVDSSALSTNETKLYLGMRQYVGELDLETKKLRLLVPSDDFIHKLPQKDADQIKRCTTRVTELTISAMLRMSNHNTRLFCNEAKGPVSSLFLQVQRWF